MEALAAVDGAATVEFLREALIRVDEDELAAVAGLLEARRRRLAHQLDARALHRGGAEAVRPILGEVFATRRRVDEVLVCVGGPTLATAIAQLVHGPAARPARLDAFERATAALEPPVRRELAGECLHAMDPAAAPLWSRWLWDPGTRTGALRLVMADDFDFGGDAAGAAYERVAAATAAVAARADELGFHRLHGDPLLLDAHLAAIYAVYLTTVVRLRMSQEFLRVIPGHADLVRRLLGVHVPAPARAA
jgi:hypothetical protein